jgi:multiple sugar transport system substrate-binding protein
MAFVVGTSPNKDEAVKFLRWLTEAEQQAKYATTSFNLPANVTVADAVPMNDALTAFSANMDKIQPTLKSSMTAEVETTMTKGIQRILAGEDTPENVAKLMQTAYETGQAQ